ncbi:PH domain-containing protein [Chryseobacterium camelliae]|uniref:YokE-like PH domain-containing protein n=1 Tax=Chryseobacterium camelliae TaxID=1265445 RepID=A0ABU0TMM3_9FLAO|nr:PH domain-containing protein [Chryseobacterium camelliae]MDQ1098295.1 hypothetical protein [Chryseobacterium camelliae]
MNLRQFLNEEQDPKAVEKLLVRINSLLTSKEFVEYIAVQKKPALNISPDCIALTNRRIIFCRPRNFGLSMDFQDYGWQDVLDCHIKEGIIGSAFTMRTVKNFSNMMDYLPKAQARKPVSVCSGNGRTDERSTERKRPGDQKSFGRRSYRK